MFIFPNFKNITFSDTFSGNLNHFPSSLPDSPTQKQFIRIKIPSHPLFLSFSLVGFGGGTGLGRSYNIIGLFLYQDFGKMVFWHVLKLETSFRVITFSKLFRRDLHPPAHPSP
jgi:hypothetical protein